MSLILEALRKSEAERRRGLAPDLYSELPPVAQRRDARLTPALWWMLAVAVLAVSAWLMRGLSSPSASADTVVITAQTDRVGTQPPVPRPMPQAAAVVITPRSVDSVAARVAVTDATPSTTTPPAVPTMAPARPAQPSTPDKVVAVPERTTATPPPAPPAPVRALPPPLPRPVAAAAPTPVATSASVASPAAPASTPPASSSVATLKLTDLTAEQRKQLPALRMSMHMWDQSPARRFVIIDGTRRAEGDRIGEAVIAQITTDSVLLDWNGLRLRVSMR